MKKINVIVRDRNTLILEEDGVKGDIIDLTNISNVDLSRIEHIFKEGTDMVYHKHLEEQKNALKKEFETQMELLKKSHSSELSLKLAELSHQKELEVTSLKDKLSSMQKEFEGEISKNKLAMENTYHNELADLKHTIELLKTNYDKELSLKLAEASHKKELELLELKEELQKKDTEKQMALAEHQAQLEKERLEAERKWNELQEKYYTLKRQKASLNVKQTGEDLESWCDLEVKSYMQNGLGNCVWEKDNKVIREETEVKGSKADYIFKIYASKEHTENTLLASLCLEMKDENPDSVNRKRNIDYYNTLDKNRRKKECRYAVLVSNLELDKPNDIPIYKVNEYEDMYVVRPAYLMTFLNMVVSITSRFADLVLKEDKKHLELLHSVELKEKFNELKERYLDKPLEGLEKQIEDIKGQSVRIIDSARKIEEICNKMTSVYVNGIMEKLHKFDIEIDKAYRKFNKASE